MNFEMKPKNWGKIWQWYTLAFAILFVSYAFTIIASGHTLIWQADASTQHIPVLQSFYKSFWYWISHLGQGMQQWTWNMGLGSSTVAVYSYYVIGDVFSYPALLFPYSWLPTVFAITCVIRYYCAGLAFCYLASHFKFSVKSVVAGAIAYLGSSFVFYAVIAQPFFLNPLCIFPLLILATEKYLHNGRLLPLVGMFFWTFANNFYFAYMLGLGYGIYALIRIGTHYSQFRELLWRYLKIIGAAVLGAALSGVILLPAMISIHNSVRSQVSVFANGITLYPFSYYFSLPVRLITYAGGSYWASLVFVAPTVIAVLFVWVRFKQYPMLAICSLLMGVFLLFPAVASAFNGFSSPYNRWLMLTFLPLGLIISVLIEQLGTITRKEFVVITLGVVGYGLVFSGLLWMMTSRFDYVRYYGFFYLILAWGIFALAVWNKSWIHHFQLGMAVLVVLNASVNAYLYVAPANYGFAKQTIQANSTNQADETMFAGYDKTLKNPSIYRVNVMGGYSVSNGVILDNAPTSNLMLATSFYSVIDKSNWQFSTAVGNNSFSPIRALGQLDNRTILMNFLGIKYLFAQNGRYAKKLVPYSYKQVAAKAMQVNGKKTQVNVYCTDNNLPLLWWDNRYLMATQANKLSDTQREAMLLNGVEVDDNVNVTALKQAKTTNTVQAVKFYVVDSKGKKITADKLNYNMLQRNQYRIVIANSKKYKNSELHVELSDITGTSITTKEMMAQTKYRLTHLSKAQKQNDSADKNFLTKTSTLAMHNTLMKSGQTKPGFAIAVYSSNGSNRAYQRPSSILPSYQVIKQTTLNLGYYSKKLPNSLGVKFNAGGMKNVSCRVKVYAVNLGNNYQKAVKTIQQNALTNVKKTTNQVTANYNRQKVGIVTTTIPYSTGWSAYVDGKKVAVIETNYGFVGFNAPAGKHSVKLVYTTPGLKLGAILSVLGILGVALIAVWKRQKSYFRKNLDKIK